MTIKVGDPTILPIILLGSFFQSWLELMCIFSIKFCPAIDQLILSWLVVVESDDCALFLYHMSFAIYPYHKERSLIDSIKRVSSLKPVEMHLSYNIP